MLAANPTFADDLCLSPATITTMASKGEVGKEAARQLSQICSSVKLEKTATGSVSLMEVLRLAFGQVPKVRGDRLKPTAPPGMPVGLVMPRDGRVLLDFADVMAEGVTSLEIDGPGVGIQQRPPGGTAIEIPASQLQPGASYRWMLKTRRQAYDGTFVLPDLQTMKRTEQRLQLLPSLSNNPVTLLALEAAIYDDEEIFVSRDRTVALLRRELQRP